MTREINILIRAKLNRSPVGRSFIDRPRLLKRPSWDLAGKVARFLGLLLLGLSLAWSVPASAQDGGVSSATAGQIPAGADRPLRFDRISTERGLSGNEVWSIAQDKRGYMWFGTTNGLNRYDGYKFTVFKHDPDDVHSLSENLIRALYTDHTGTLWIGTWSAGLNKYVPETDRFIRYQHDPEDAHSLGSDSIRVIFEDQAGALWIGTVGGGLNRFDRETEQFVRYLNNPDDPGSLSGNDIYSIYEDRAGALWVATWMGGLNKFDRETEQFTRYLHNPDDPYSLSNNNPYAIYEDRTGVLWIGTWDAGLNRFDQETEQFSRYGHDPEDPHSLSHDQAISIYEDQAGQLWIGTNGGGLNRFDRKSERFFRYQNTTTDPYSLAQNNVVPIFEDRSGLVWFGTFGGGISIYDRRKQNFDFYRHDSADPTSLASDDVWAIHEDRAGNHWIGTNGGGLNRFDRQTGRFIHYLHDPDDPHSLSNNSVRDIYEDKAGHLWLGTVGGLNRFDRQTEQFTRYRHDPDDPNSLSHNTVVRILEDQTGTLWAATIGGLNSFDRETGQFTRYLYDPDNANSLSHNVVWTIYEDRAGDLWVGTESGGLNRFDRETKRFIRYRHDPNDPTSLSRDGVLAIREDQAGTLWIGTFGGGLNSFDRTTGQFTYYGEKEGLPSDSIAAILEDEQGNLWLGTSGGISRFNPQSETFKNYDVSDGLQGSEFNSNAAFRRSDGQMFFGSVNGLNAFYPADLQDNSHIPPIVITDFRLANEPVPIGGDSVLQRAINETGELVLSYQNRVISFEFAALDFSVPERNRYRYKLEGFEDQWNEVGYDRRFVTYTNLDPGEYVFRITGSNNDGVWNEAGRSIKIAVTPPWWQTSYFRGTVIVLLVGLVAGGFARQRRSAQKREHQLEALIAERTHELELARYQAEAANRAKSTFLANMSHELRTPLNTILGYAQLMGRDSDTSPNLQEKLAVIDRSGEHLLTLIDDVLEMARIEAGRVSLSEQAFDLYHLLWDLEEMFRLSATNKGLQLRVEWAADVPQYVRAGQRTLRQVLINLLSNAIKFTDKGRVTLRVGVGSQESGVRRQELGVASQELGVRGQGSRSRIPNSQPLILLHFEVEDTGRGIAPDEMGTLFEPFVQTAAGQQSQTGTGLGLAISRQFVQLMGGELTAGSPVFTSPPAATAGGIERGPGAVFHLSIPVTVAEPVAAPVETPARRVVGLAPDQPAYRILVADDNAENRHLLATLLVSLGFEVQEAGDGQETLQTWQTWRPHLIFMDLRMPGMDGYEATRRIRQTEASAEPKLETAIIALTASAFEEERADVLAAGCDDYLRKPFREADIFDVIHRRLGVRYIYKDIAVSRARPGVGEKFKNADLQSEIAALPAELVARLGQAAARSDLNEIDRAINEIRDHNLILANSLAQLAHNFKYRQIMVLIQEAEGRS